MVVSGPASAAAAGFRTGSTPQVGAIASWDDGGWTRGSCYGCGVSTRIQVSNSNYDGSGTQPMDIVDSLILQHHVVQ